MSGRVGGYRKPVRFDFEVFYEGSYTISPPDSILRAISKHVARLNGDVVSFSEKPDCYFLVAKNSHYTDFQDSKAIRGERKPMAMENQ